jgi:cytochrome c-type biogenesis protein CcmH/NrfF
MTITTQKVWRWVLPILATVLGALLTTAAAEAWGLPARVTTLEANEKASKELLMEVRQDVKELLRR